MLPEVDYLLLKHVGPKLELAFARDLADGCFPVEWGSGTDLYRAREPCDRYRALRLGIVDAVVMAMAERLRAQAIATLDVRHLGAAEV
ncbi:MAG TPA: hypothetical protein VFW98_06700 [Gemmatimonadaceae bacterium]|nr:hypothetical protein [Gemmatimonadaceae bacterium]